MELFIVFINYLLHIEAENTIIFIEGAPDVSCSCICSLCWPQVHRAHH